MCMCVCACTAVCKPQWLPGPFPTPPAPPGPTSLWSVYVESYFKHANIHGAPQGRERLTLKSVFSLFCGLVCTKTATHLYCRHVCQLTWPRVKGNDILVSPLRHKCFVFLVCLFLWLMAQLTIAVRVPRSTSRQWWSKRYTWYTHGYTFVYAVSMLIFQSSLHTHLSVQITQ